MKRTVLGAALLLSVALPAWAQAPTAPGPFQDAPGLVYQGQSGGLDYWYFEGADFMIGQNAQDGSVIIGYVFDQDGQDISAAITGADPLQFSDFLPPEGVEDQTAAPEAAPTISDLVPQPGIIQQDNQLLENAPEAVRNELLAVLVGRLAEAQTQEDYERILLAWREEVRTRLGQQPAPSVPQNILDLLNTQGAGSQAPANAPTQNEVQEQPSTEAAPEAPAAPDTAAAPQPSAETPAAPAEEGDASTLSDAAPAILQNPITALMPGADSPSASQAEVLDEVTHALAFDTLSSDSRWVALGEADAPVVYVVIDPTCPYCARTLVELEDDVMNGDLQLRVVLAGLLNERAIETVAGILLSDTPAKTLFDNAHARTGAEGYSAAPLRNATDLPEEIRNDLEINRQNVISLGVQQVPFFAWATAEGFRTATGVPNEGLFADALPEAPAE